MICCDHLTKRVNYLSSKEGKGGIKDIGCGFYFSSVKFLLVLPSLNVFLSISNTFDKSEVDTDDSLSEPQPRLIQQNITISTLYLVLAWSTI